MSAPYAHPEVLVNYRLGSSHASLARDANVRVVEVDVDTKAYDEGHVPGAIAWAWNTQLCDTVVRDILPKASLRGFDDAVRHRQRHHGGPLWRQQQLVRGLGLLADEDLRPQGRAHHGRRPQEVAGGRPRSGTTAAAKPSASSKPYQATRPDYSLRAFLPQVQQAQKSASAVLIDVRSPQEFTRRNSRASRTARNLPARRPHSGRAQRPLGQSVQ